jgi:NADH-quinone oxidoreductase subunit C
VSWLEDIEAAYGRPAEPGFGPPTVDVEPAHWVEALTIARDRLGCAFFDFLTAVDDEDDGIWVVAHLATSRPGGIDSLLIRTIVPSGSPSIPCVCGVYAGAAWHERETREMFGVDIVGHDRLEALLLPDNFEGHPLRKDFVLASRVAKPWPGAKEPGESDHDSSPSRRRTRPPGVPDPAEWPRP